MECQPKRAIGFIFIVDVAQTNVAGTARNGAN